MTTFELTLHLGNPPHPANVGRGNPSLASIGPQGKKALAADPGLRIAHVSPRRQASLLARLLAAVLSLTATACNTPTESERLAIQERVLPRPEPTFVRLAHDVRFQSGRAEITAAEVQALDRFLAQHQVSRDDEIAVSTSFADGIAGTDIARRNAVARILERRHFRVAALPDAFDGEPQVAGLVHVTVHRTLVTLPVCPDWTGPARDDRENQPYANFGCADAINLGLMIARPSDLARGRTPGPLDGETGAAAIERYRLGKTKPLDSDSKDPSPVNINVSGASGGAK